MNKALFLLFTAILPFMAIADDWDPQSPGPIAEVQKVVGQVFFNGLNLKVGDKIEKNGSLETRDKSMVQFKIAAYNNIITIGPRTKMTFNLTGEKKYVLEEGSCRWKTEIKNALKSPAKGKIFTKTVAMGVRGTDFLVKSNALFGEVEIIMFDGEVLMDNLEDSDNSVIVKKGQWGGMGGRFGKKIAPPLDIPPSALAQFEKLIESK